MLTPQSVPKPIEGLDKAFDEGFRQGILNGFGLMADLEGTPGASPLVRGQALWPVLGSGTRSTNRRWPASLPYAPLAPRWDRDVAP